MDAFAQISIGFQLSQYLLVGIRDCLLAAAHQRRPRIGGDFLGDERSLRLTHLSRLALQEPPPAAVNDVETDSTFWETKNHSLNRELENPRFEDHRGLQLVRLPESES